jgi:preprotein translocase subunit Sec61beta
LQILYFDSIDTGFIKVDPNIVPRVKVYTGAVMSALIEADTMDSAGAKTYGH